MPTWERISFVVKVFGFYSRVPMSITQKYTNRKLRCEAKKGVDGKQETEGDSERRFVRRMEQDKAKA